MVGKSSLMQSLKTFVGMGSLSQVLFGAFSTSYLIRSDGIGSKLVKSVPYSYRIELLSSDNVTHEKIKGFRKMPTLLPITRFEY